MAHSDTENQTDASLGTIDLRGVKAHTANRPRSAYGLSLAIRKEDGVEHRRPAEPLGTEMQTEYGSAAPATMTGSGRTWWEIRSQPGPAESTPWGSKANGSADPSVFAGRGSAPHRRRPAGVGGELISHRGCLEFRVRVGSGRHRQWAGGAEWRTDEYGAHERGGPRRHRAAGGHARLRAVDGVVAQRDPDFSFADVQQTRLQNLGLNTADMAATVGNIDLTGLRGSLRGQELDASLQRGVANDMSGQFRNGQSLGIPTSGVPYVDMGQHQLDANLGLRSGKIRLGGGSAATIRDAASPSTRPMWSVPYRCARAKWRARNDRPGTTLQAGVMRDGRLVANRTGVQNANYRRTAVDDRKGCLSARGSPRRSDDGRCRWVLRPEHNSRLTSGLTGDESSHIPMEVGPLAQRLTRGQTEEEATGAITLGRERETDNVVQVRSRASGLAAQFTRLLVASMRFQTSNGEIQTGRTAVSSAQLTTTGTPNMPSVVDGSVGRIEVESLSTRQTFGAE